METKKVTNILFIGLVLFLAGCTGKDGDPGPGYAEATKYGNIKVTFVSKRPTDNVDFKSETDFKFFPTGSFSFYSSQISTGDKGEKYIDVSRYVSGVDKYSNDNYFYFYLTVSPDNKVTYFDFEVENSIIDGLKQFEVDEYITSNTTDGDTNEIKDYSYDPATGRLKFNFTWTVKQANSSTANDFTMTGTVDVIVLEALNHVNGGE